MAEAEGAATPYAVVIASSGPEVVQRSSEFRYEFRRVCVAETRDDANLIAAALNAYKPKTR